MKMSRFLIPVFIMLVLAVFSAPLFAAENSGAPEGALSSFLKFNSGEQNRYEADFDAAGKLAGITVKDARAFSAGEPASRSDALAAAEKFLEKNAVLFGIKNPGDLSAEKIECGGRVTHALFSHRVNGKRVLGSEISVHVNGALEIVSVNNSIVFPVEAPSAAAALLGAEEAVEIAKRSVGCTKLRGEIKTESVIYTGVSPASEAILVEIPSRDPLGDFVCVIDASTGAVIETTDILNYDDANAPGASDKLPAGSVYMFNPLRGPVVNESLLNLTSVSQGLIGKWAAIVNEDSAPASPDAEGDFIFAPENTHFDEVNAYFHTDKIHGFFAKYGFKGLDRPMKVTVHYGNKFDNAFFSPQTGTIALGDGNKLNDLAKEETVIYHEYVHASTNAIVKMPYSSESGAMNEAFSDYFSASLTEDPVVGEWTVAKLNKPYIRNLENKAHYPENIHDEVHMDSNIYSGALWDLRKVIGAEAVDKITHFSRYYLIGISSPKFSDGLKALIKTDKEHYAGANEETIVEVFGKRGIKAVKGNFARGRAIDGLRFEALNGSREAAQALSDIENGNSSAESAGISENGKPSKEYLPGYGYTEPGYKYQKGRELSSEFLNAFWQDEEKVIETAQHFEGTIEFKLGAGLRESPFISNYKELSAPFNVNFGGHAALAVNVSFDARTRITTQARKKYAQTKIWFELFRRKNLSGGDWELCGKTYEMRDIYTNEEVVTEARFDR